MQISFNESSSKASVVNSITRTVEKTPVLVPKKLSFKFNRCSDLSYGYLKTLFNNLKLEKPKIIQKFIRSYKQLNTMKDSSRVTQLLEKFSQERLKIKNNNKVITSKIDNSNKPDGNPNFKSTKHLAEIKNTLNVISSVSAVETNFTCMAKMSKLGKGAFFQNDEDLIIENSISKHKAQNSGRSKGNSHFQDEYQMKKSSTNGRTTNKKDSTQIEEIDSILQMDFDPFKASFQDMNKSSDKSEISISPSKYLINSSSSEKELALDYIEIKPSRKRSKTPNTKFFTQNRNTNEKLQKSNNKDYQDDEDDDFTPINLKESFPLLYKFSEKANINSLEIDKNHKKLKSLENR